MKTDKTRKEVTDALSEWYETVTVMSEGEGKTVVQVRHRKTGRPFIIKSFEGGAPVYEFLSGIECEGLPRVCDVITKEQALKVAREAFEPCVYDFVEKIICLLTRKKLQSSRRKEQE